MIKNNLRKFMHRVVNLWTANEKDKLSTEQEYLLKKLMLKVDKDPYSTSLVLFPPIIADPIYAVLQHPSNSGRQVYQSLFEYIAKVMEWDIRIGTPYIAHKTINELMEYGYSDKKHKNEIFDHMCSDIASQHRT